VNLCEGRNLSLVWNCIPSAMLLPLNPFALAQ
jgi:hypothetical protein